MRLLRNALSVGAVVIGGVVGLGAYAASQTAKEDYIPEPMPPGFQVVVTDLEGPVFADARGHTIYKWPKKDLRNGVAGEVQGKPTCGETPTRENAGLMSPYPGGFELPEVDTRPACSTEWPPVLASADAKPVGKWTVIARDGGKKQWAYEGWPLYTTIVDREAGDVNGATGLTPEDPFAAYGALRKIIAPKQNVPPQFSIYTSMAGRSVETADKHSVYSYDRDGRNKSNCVNACLNDWQPILAADFANKMGEWTTFERSPGVKQWAFRGMPVYRRISETHTHMQDGSDVPGWHNVYMQKAPSPPKEFVVKDVAMGSILGDERGMTVYKYICSDDAVDQLQCDYPEAPQIYRFTVCGGGDPARCVKTFPYVVAPGGAKTGNHVWGTMYINPMTGKRAMAGEKDALSVWTFRGRPLYTFAGRNGYGDTKPENANADNWGEFSAKRNGFQAILYRSPFGY